MSLFSSIGSALSKVWKTVKPVVGSAVGSVIGGPVGGAIGGAVMTGKGAPSVLSLPSAGSGGPLVPVGGKGVLPGAGAVAAGLGGLAAGAYATYKMNAAGQMVPVKRRRRRRGITGTELKNHARVERFLDRNFKCKSGGSRRSYVRKR